MKDLQKLFQQKLSYLEAAPDFVENVYVTRLKKEILKRTPGLFEQKNEVLFKVSNNSITDEGTIISETAKIICKSMFENVEIFDGDFSFQKQKASASKQLVQLIPLILKDNT